MALRDALDSLGVSAETLSPDERRLLDEQGYLRLEGVLAAEEVAAFAACVDDIAAREGERAGSEWYREVGVVRLCNLLDKSPLFERCLTEPRVLAAVHRVLGDDFKLSALDSRNPLPGHGRQALHVDWPGGAVAPGDFQVCNSAWLLDDFTLENGAPRLVPGTHRAGRIPAEAMADTRLPHPDQIRLVGRAGTVIVFNGHVWHGGIVNRSAGPRRTVYAYFCRGGLGQQLDRRQELAPETRRRLRWQSRVIAHVDREES